MRSQIIYADDLAPLPKRRFVIGASVSPPPGTLTVFKKLARVSRFDEIAEGGKRPVNLEWLLVAGTSQLILMGAGPQSGIVGIPTLVGGNTGLQVFIGGVLVSCPLIQGLGQSASAVHISSQTIGRWTATLDFFDDSNNPSFTLPELGQSVQILEAGQKRFAGCIDSIQIEFISWKDTSQVCYHLTCVDKSGILDHRVVLQSFASGIDGAKIINSMWTDSTYCNPPISAEGITLNGVPASLGATTAAMPAQLPTVRAVLDNLATDLGGVWWVDQLGSLNFQLLPDLGTCPYSLNSTGGGFRLASMTSSLLEYATKDYALSDRTVTPGAGSTGPTGMTVTETYTLPQAAAAARGFVYDAIITNYPILRITQLSWNGTPEPTYSAVQTPNISFRHTWWYFPGTPYLTGPNIQGLNPFPDPPATSPDPSPGDTIVITYIAPVQQSAVSPGDPLTPTTGLCGSGVFEVVEQVKGITTQADLNAIAAAALTKRNVIPKTIKFDTDQVGAQVGQRISVDLPRLDLSSTTLLITSVDMTAQPGVLQYGSRFRSTITATNTADFGNWIKWFERLFVRTENAAAVPRFETATFVLAPGGSLTSGIVTLNPYVVKNTGTVTLTTAIAGTPQTGQQLDIEIISASQGFVSRISIPDSSTTLQQTTQTVASPGPFVLFVGDVLTISVNYSSVGSNPVPAANVTVNLTISY